MKDWGQKEKIMQGLGETGETKTRRNPRQMRDHGFLFDKKGLGKQAKEYKLHAEVNRRYGSGKEHILTDSREAHSEQFALVSTARVSLGKVDN